MLLDELKHFPVKCLQWSDEVNRQWPHKQAWCFVLHSEAAGCLLVHYQWSDISGGQLSLDTSHPEVTLSCFYALGSESLTQQRRKSRVRRAAVKKKVRLEMQVPWLAARGQIVADSAETGQLRCCSHGPPAFVPITAADLKQKKTQQKHEMPNINTLPQVLISMLTESHITSN